MPGKNGIDATKEMVAIDRNAKVLVCSASNYEYDTQPALDAGAKAIILKPIVPKEVYESIKQALGGK